MSAIALTLGSPRARGRREAFSRQHFARVLQIAFALKKEGAGKTGCALHPRSRVQTVHQETHTSIQVQRRQSGLPCAMALRLISCSPRRPGFLATVANELLRRLDASVGASGPHDFAVRNTRLRQEASPGKTPFVRAKMHVDAVASIASRFAFRDDCAYAPPVKRDDVRMPLICLLDQENQPRQSNTTGKSPNRCQAFLPD
jgi:hypothetical protein